MREKLEQYFFHPPEKRWLIWIGAGPLFVLATAAFALLAFSPFHAIVLLLSLFSYLVFWKVSSKMSILAVFVLTGFALFCFPSEMRWWNGCWLVSLIMGLLISLYAISEGRGFFQEREKKTEECTKESELWQHRFATMKDKIEEDRKLWEDEIDVVRAELEEKKSHVQSLKTLLEVIHRDAAQAAKRIQELKQREEPEKFEFEGKVITKDEIRNIVHELRETQEKLKAQEAAIQERQKRNQSLLGTNNRKSISLKDLAKKP